jgi:GAF domain-containing protein
MPSERDQEFLDVAEIFGKVARELLVHHDVQGTLDRIVHLAVEHLAACEFAGISFVDGRKISSPASSDEVPRILDRIQSEVDEGPCLDAIRECEVFCTPDLSVEGRWPRFSLRAHEETGVRSILAVRLFAATDTLGALNLYSTRLDAFGDVDAALAAVFATHAAVAIASAKRECNLERKAATRDLIGRAKGILMSQEHVTEDQAFDILRRASQDLNVKLSEVAEQVNYSGERPIR